MTKLCGIYCITHIESGRKYVGQSRDINKRLYQHSLGLCKMRLGKAIASYGWKAFSTEVLELCEIPLLNENESKWVSTINSISPYGFNLTAGGNQQVFVSDETRTARSNAQKGRQRSAATKSKLRELGLNRSDEYKAKISEANQRRIYTPELISKMGAGNKGRQFSESHRAKISAACKNRAPTTLGMKHTDDAKARMSASRTGKKQTAEHTKNAVAAKAAKRLLRQRIAAASA